MTVRVQMFYFLINCNIWTDCRRGNWGNQCDAKCNQECNTGCYKTDGKCCPKFKLGASCLKCEHTWRCNWLSYK